MQPKVIEKRVEVPVPAPFSWKDEFTGKRLIAKGVVGAVFAGSTWMAYRKGNKTGYAKGYSSGRTDTREINEENQALRYQVQNNEATINNLHRTIDGMKQVQENHKGSK
jgi:hypothetical protein